MQLSNQGTLQKQLAPKFPPDGEASKMLEFWVTQSTPSLSFLPGLVVSEVVALNRVLSNVWHFNCTNAKLKDNTSHETPKLVTQATHNVKELKGNCTQKTQLMKALKAISHTKTSQSSYYSKQLVMKAPTSTHHMSKATCTKRYLTQSNSYKAFFIWKFPIPFALT